MRSWKTGLLALVALGSLVWACARDDGANREEPPAGDAAPDTGGGALTGEAKMDSVWEAARLRGIEFRALGQEPGWTLEIDEGNRIHFVGDYGEKHVEVPAPAPETDPGTGRKTYRVETEAHTLLVAIQPDSCWDAMSGFPFPNTVTVTVDSVEYRGCGRPLP